MAQRAHWRLALLLMGASGFAGLGYQVAWTQQATLWLGHESAGVLAVVAAFFGGLGVGALLLAPRIEAGAPGRWYAGCEAAIGAWSLALAWLLTPTTELMLGLIGAEPSPAKHWLVAFAGTFVVLLPATAPMGATLVALERVLVPARQPGAIAALYAANTFGAVLGVLGSAFVLIPRVGLTATAAVCATFNLLCALVALRVFKSSAAPLAHREGPPPVSNSATAAFARARLVWLLAATGLLGIGYEVLVVRVVSQIAENTVYTFAILLAVYLIGTALGAAVYSRRIRAAGDPTAVTEPLLVSLAAACLLGTLALAGGGAFKAWAFGRLAPSMASALAAEAVLGAAGFLLPTAIMGALFSHLATQARLTGVGLGRALASNTLGAATAPALFGVLIVPAFGTKPALLLVAFGYWLLGSRRALRRRRTWAVAAAALALFAALPPLVFVDVPEGGRLVRYREGVLGTVSVIEDAAGVASLRINNRQQEGSSATHYADSRQALLPLLLHAAPTSVLFLGLGTGITASAAAEEATVDVEVVELIPEVVAASRYFVERANDPAETRAYERLEIVAADARRFTRAATKRYDVIVADNFHPARSGSAALYTVEHFAAVRDRLAHGGVFCQWLPLHQLDLATLRSIVRTFLAVYPDGRALLATYSLDTPVLGLVNLGGSGLVDVDRMGQRLAAANGARRRTSPSALGIGDDLALLGTFVGGPASLSRFAGNAPLNTDDRPLVAYLAPHSTYAPSSPPRDRLLALLDELSITPGELVELHDDATLDARLAAYWEARDRFIAAGRNVKISADVKEMLSQVREPLLDVLRISPDFQPAYDPLLQMAVALAAVDSANATSLLRELDAVQPARDDAARALLEVDGRAH